MASLLLELGLSVMPDISLYKSPPPITISKCFRLLWKHQWSPNVIIRWTWRIYVNFFFILLFLKGLDFVIYEARRHGIKLILSLVNNYDNFGGKHQYVKWARNDGHNITSEDDFFTNTAVKGFYKNHIKVMFFRFYLGFSLLISSGLATLIPSPLSNDYNTINVDRLFLQGTTASLELCTRRTKQ